MRLLQLEDMTRGWFVGDFEPTAYATDAVEVAVKSYSAGDTEPMHVHRIATELTTVVSGTVSMAGHELGAGHIAVLDPGEPSDFRAVTDAIVVAVKVPAVAGDKYLIDDGGTEA